MKMICFDCGQAKDRFGVPDGEYVREIASFYDEPLIYTGQIYPLSEITLKAPFTGEKIVAAGLNYRSHAAELGMEQKNEPVIFIKPPSSVLDPGGRIVIPWQSSRVDFEGELALIIKKSCRNVSASEAAEYILGYTVINDVTARDIQKLDGQWTRAKCFDSFCPMGPAVLVGEEPLGRDVTVSVNGEVRQSGNTNELICSPFELVEFVSSVMTLCEGDVISTGTPPGVGQVFSGDCVCAEISGIGRLENHVE